MPSLEEEIRQNGQNRNSEELERVIKDATVDELKELVRTKLKSPNFNYTWNYILQAFADTSEDCHEKRFKISMVLLKEIEKQNLSTNQFNVLIHRLCMELAKFKSEHIVELCTFCLESIQSKDDTQMSWKDLLPELLNVLVERSSFEHDDMEYTGSEYKSNFINTLCMIQWSPNIITPLTSIFTEMPLTKEEHFKVVNKLGQFIEKMTPQEIPAFIYQVLRFCKNHNIRSIFLRLQNYFGLRIYDQPNNINIETNSESLFDSIETTSNQDTIEAESTVLYHIHTSASLGHECIKDYLSSLKNLIKSPEFILHPFQLTLLFTISTISHYKETVFEIIRPAIVKCYQEEIKKNHSCWFREMIQNKLKVEDVFVKIVNLSLHDRDLTLQALVNFAFVLLGVGSALGRDIMAEKQWNLGNMIILKIIKRKRNFVPVIIQILSNSIVTGHSVTQYIECMYILSKSFPLSMLETQSCIVELMEGLVQVPGSIATQLLDAIIPLTKVSPTIRDHLILLLRKALYSRVVETRQMAVIGFLKLLTNLKISNLAVLSQSSNSSGSFASGHSIFTQLSLNRASQSAPSTFSNEALCLEVLSILKRCFMQQAEVRSRLYEGLYDAVCMNPELGGPVLDVMWFHFKDFYVFDEEILPPFNFNKIVIIRDVDAVLQEPLGKLIYAIGLIVTKVQETDEENETLIKFREVLESSCRRMILCELNHFELNDGTDLLDILPESQKRAHILKEALNVFEALMGYKICSWGPQSENFGQQINNLHQGYSRIQHFSKTLTKPKKVGQKKGDKSTQLNNSTVVSSQKKDASHKSKSLKLPETLWNFQTIIKIVRILNENDLEWVNPVRANTIKTKREYHQYVMQATMQAIQNSKNFKSIDTQYSKSHYDSISDIAAILYKNIVIKLNNFIDFDCASAILAMECFHSALLIIVNHYKSNLKAFFKKLGNTEDEELVFHLTKIIEVYQKHFEIDEEETSSDPEIKKLSLVVVNTLTVLINQISANNTSLSIKVYEWLKTYAYNNQLTSKISTVFINLLFETHIKFKVSLNLLENISVYMGDIIGVITEEEHQVEKFEFLNEATVHNTLLCLSNTIKSVLEDIESIIARLRSEYNIIAYPGDDNLDKKKQYLKNKEKGVCCQLCFIVTILTNLSNLSIAPGNLSDAVFKNIQLLFCTLTSLTKYFMMCSSKANVTFQGARFERLVKLAGKQLAPIVYKFILYIEEAQKQNTESTQAKKKNVDSTTLKSKVLRETRQIPKAVYEMEQFSKCITQLTNKTKVDLTKYVGQGIVRDFRILQLKEVLEQGGETSFATTQNTEAETSREQESEEESESDSESTPPPSKKVKT